MFSDESLLAKICTRTTFHGPLDFYQSKGWGRLFWALVTLASFVAAGYYSYQTVLQYSQQQTATSIADVHVDQLRFPNVTVCNPARYNATWIVDQVDIPPTYAAQLAAIPITVDDFKREFVRYLRTLSFSIEPYDTDDPTVRNLLYALGQLYDQMFNKSTNPAAGSITQFIRDATFDCEKHLVECKFAQVPFNCCDYVRMAFTDYGYCYTLDVGANRTTDTYQTAAGEDFGLEVTVEIDNDHILVQDAVENSGIRVHVVDYATALDANPVAAPPNVHARVRLDPVHYVLNSAVDQCLDQPRPSEPYEAYTKTLCQLHCYDTMVDAAARCKVMASFVERNPREICPPITMLTEVFPRMMGLANDSMQYRTNLLNCFSTCPKMCDYWAYSTCVMYSDTSEQATVNTSTTTGNNTATVKLSVFFAELVYEEYQEQLLTDPNVFISNLGGVLGLWTGVSIISIIQCLVIAIFGPCEEDSGACGCGRRKK